MGSEPWLDCALRSMSRSMAEAAADALALADAALAGRGALEEGTLAAGAAATSEMPPAEETARASITGAATGGGSASGLDIHSRRSGSSTIRIQSVIPSRQA